MIPCPIAGSISSGPRLVQHFGERPEVYKQFGLKGHSGLDYTGPVKGALVPIYSPIRGVVAEIGNQGTAGYGLFIRLRSLDMDDQGRKQEVVLAHLSDVSKKLKLNMYVPLYDEIGRMGNTGFSTGPHLHWGLRFLNSFNAVLNYDNGFKGYVDFEPFVFYVVNPEEVKKYVQYPNG